MINYFTFPGVIFETVGLINKAVLKPTDNEIVEKIFFQVELVTSVTKAEIMSRQRITRIRQARQLIHFFCREHTDLGYADIGYLTNRDHSSVIHSVKTVKNDLKTDVNLMKMLDKIGEKLKEELLIV